jgi:hypothetical protein
MILIVYNGDEELDRFEDVSDDNLDGTLGVYRNGYCIAEYEEGEWTHISALDDEGKKMF